MRNMRRIVVASTSLALLLAAGASVLGVDQAAPVMVAGVSWA